MFMKLIAVVCLIFAIIGSVVIASGPSSPVLWFGTAMCWVSVVVISLRVP